MTQLAATYDYSNIRTVVQNYIDGFVQRDTNLLRQTFSESARLIAVDEGKILELAASDWFVKLDERKKSGAPIALASSEITSIQQTHNAAIAVVRLDFPTYGFTDYLSLLKTPSGWLIANKIYATH